METLKNDGSSSFDVEEILSNWQNAFEKLYSNEGDFDDEFFHHIQSMKNDFDAFTQIIIMQMLLMLN